MSKFCCINDKEIMHNENYTNSFNKITSTNKESLTLEKSHSELLPMSQIKLSFKNESSSALPIT